LNKFEDTLEKFVKATLVRQENNIAAIRNLEMNLGQIAKQLAERQSDQFSANSQTNLE